jgi:hypothetical protein
MVNSKTTSHAVDHHLLLFSAQGTMAVLPAAHVFILDKSYPVFSEQYGISVEVLPRCGILPSILSTLFKVLFPVYPS